MKGMCDTQHLSGDIALETFFVSDFDSVRIGQQYCWLFLEGLEVDILPHLPDGMQELLRERAMKKFDPSKLKVY